MSGWRAYNDWECGIGWDYYIGPSDSGNLDLAIAVNLSEENANRIIGVMDAARMLADWAEHEVGADMDLTPGLAELRRLL